MVLIDSIKKSFLCVIENPSITLFLVIFLICSNLLAKYVLTAKTFVLELVFLICLFALLAVFLSGWFKVIKESTEREKIREKNFYSLFLEGIGEKVIPVFTSILVYMFFFFSILFLAQFLALKLFGNINFFFEGINKVAVEESNFTQYFSSLDVNQKYIIYGWNLLIMASLTLFNFLSMFYFPSVISSKSKVYLSCFTAILDNLKFLFKNFFQSVAMGIFILILYTILTILNARFIQNPVISILFLLVYIYFISYTVMLIFNYYEAKNNSFDRIDGLGENEAGNSAGKED